MDAQSHFITKYKIDFKDFRIKAILIISFHANNCKKHGLSPAVLK